jgi:hypothetical protein
MPSDAEPTPPAAAPPAEALRAAADEHGFSLKSVTWGYRDLFRQSLESLAADGALDDARAGVAGEIFGLLKEADQSCFDHVLKEFLAALNPANRWLLDLPGVFADVTEMGRLFAASRVYYGIGYFRILGEGGFGETPAQVRNLMRCLRRLREIDEELAFSFLKGYRNLLERLTAEEIDLYINEGLKIFSGNPRAGCAFMEGTVKSSESIIRSLTRECRLDDVQEELTALVRALAGYEVEIADLTHLDADYLLERGTRMVCMYRWLYLPLRLRFFDSAERNRQWYLLMGVVAAALLAGKSFSAVHGHPDYTTLEDLAGEEVRRQNLLQIAEFARILRGAEARWPGVRRLLRFALETEFAEAPARSAPDRLFREVMLAPEPGPLAAGLREVADAAVNVFDTAERLRAEPVERLAAELPGLGRAPLRTVAFLPDWFYPGEVSAAPQEGLVADLKEEARAARQPEEREEEAGAAEPDESGEAAGEEEEEEREGIRGAYVYDEWSQPENDYYRDFCFVRELRPEPSPAAGAVELGEEARRIRQVFERLKPDLVRKEKYLDEGDYINPDLLLEYLINRRQEPSPPVRFYEKPLTTQRDLAVLLLLDTSGSTGEDAGPEKVLEIERRAALLLGQGLHALGDRFAVCGFSSHGREDVAFAVYKDFEEEWGREALGRIQAARPANSTRIGAALRHAGWRLSQVEARQRLIILITDGKPMDSGYDPNSRYAQYDVRMACEENERLAVHTVGISTEENSLADMEIMFPGKRFAILPDIRLLPDVLPRLYLRLTA